METLQYPVETKCKKECRCNFCSEKIVEGEVYLKSTHKFDGMVYDWKTHKHCAELATKLKMYDDAEDGVTQDIFMETVSDTYFEILVGLLPQDEIKKYSDIIQQLREVKWANKLWFVIRHFKKIESTVTTSPL